MKTYGETGWERFPSYFDTFIPMVLDILDDLDLKITFFIVGQDAAIEKNRDFLRMLTERGHEVGNHSFHHEPWLHLYPKHKVKKEVSKTEEYIHRITGKQPIGFRGPGFSWSKDLLQFLANNGYLYDSTTLPTYLGPLARAYYFRNPNLSQEEKEKRHEILGGIGEGMRPVKPYYWNLSSGDELLEIPITTIPFFKIPFHMSYLIFLSRFSVNFMFLYLRIALLMCRLSKTDLNFIVHPTDLLDCDQVPEMHFFPGMEYKAKSKLRVFYLVINELSKHYSLTNLRNHAEFILKNGNLRAIEVER